MNPAGTSLLDVDDMHTYYGESHVIQGVSFCIEAGQIVALLGRNGVGKTTTLQSILGLPAPRRGRVVYGGEQISGLPIHDITRRGIAWVPQGHRIFPTLSVAENLGLAASRARPGSWTYAKMFDLFPRLAERRGARGGSLSGGEQQMLAIARALVQNPDLILMDEPSEGLSPLLVEEVGATIRQLNQHGCAILVVEQNLTFALNIAQDVLVMNKGRIMFSGSVKALSADKEACSRYLGVTTSASEGISARPGDGRPGGVNRGPEERT